MIDQAALGPAGRTVRCTRCQTSWFAGGPEPVPAVAEPVAVEAQTPPIRTRRTGGADAPPPPAEPPAADVSSPEPEPAPAPGAAPEPETAASADAVVPQPVKAPAAAAVEPVSVADAPPLAPTIEHGPDATEADTEAAESFAARRRAMQARRQHSRRSSRWTAVILVLVALNVALVGARNEVVRYLPQTASLFAAIGLPVNLRSLKFDKVRLSTEDLDGIAMLTVQGAVTSEAGRAVGVPRLRFAVRNAGGQEVYTWTMAPPQSILEPGARMEFRSQIPVPKVDATDVMVRFLTPQDAGAK